MRLIPLRLLAMMLLSCSAHASDNVSVVQQFVAAFNAHDVDAMMSVASNDVRWMSISGSEISVEAAGKAQLAASMEDYFESLPSARAEVRSSIASGPFVHTVEKASWTSDGIENSGCGAATYEFADGKIVNVWYFQPAYECP